MQRQWQLLNLSNKNSSNTCANEYKFNGLSEIYHRFRPNYPNECVRFIISHLSAVSKPCIADIGAGSGIMSENLLRYGFFVYAIEPNNDMLHKAKENLSSYQSCQIIQANASQTTLKAQSVDLICVAQAFHWFDKTAFKCEARRILKPQAKIAIVFNIRDMQDSANIKNAEIFKRFCPQFKGFGGGEHIIDEIEAFYTTFQYKTFDNPLSYTMESFIGRCLSTSYALKSNQADYPIFMQALIDFFNQHQRNGILAMSNLTIAYLGEI